MEDVLLDDRAVDVIRAVAQRDLRELQAEADPIRGDVRKVVEVNAADGDGAERIEARGRRIHGDVVVLRLIRKRTERGEAVRLVLQSAQLPQLHNAHSKRYTVALMRP